MNAKVSYLSPASQQPVLDDILSTTRVFLLEWQQGNLKPLPTLYESIERHAKFWTALPSEWQLKPCGWRQSCMQAG